MTQSIDDEVKHAMSLHQQGQLDAAEPLYRRILEAAPDHPAALSLLGTLCLQTGRDAEAAGHLQRAVALKSDEPGWWANLGLVLRKLERYPDAASALRTALELRPAVPEVLSNLGLVLHQMADFEGAIAAFRQALSIRETPGFHLNLAATLMEIGRSEDAAAEYSRTLELAPRHLPALLGLGVAHQRSGALEAAEAAYRRAIDHDGTAIDALRGLSRVLRDQGRMEEALAASEAALAIDPTDIEGHQSLAFLRNYLSRGTPAEALQEARRVGAMMRTAALSPGNERTLDRRLRVGVVSADFRAHPVGQFFGHLLPLFDRNRLHLTCFSNHRDSDQVTLRMKDAADAWHPIWNLSNEAAAALVAKESIDVLIDLSGHTSGNRMQLFARKPAPVQATWLGYSGTTGLAEIDYIIADPIIIPAADEAAYSERVIRLPGTYLCYAPPVFSGLTPAVAPPPAAKSGRITFGTYNNIYKISDETIACWARVLAAVPNSTLLLKHRVFRTEDGQRAMAARFAAHHIGSERLRLLPPTPSHYKHFESYGEIDIALDPFPYNGTTTTCDALWMGVPVIALVGDRFISRVSASLLNAVGLADLAAPSIDAYVDTAARLAADLPRLAAIRARLRQDMMASPLGDATRFARDFELVLRQMWRNWCEAGA